MIETCALGLDSFTRQGCPMCVRTVMSRGFHVVLEHFLSEQRGL